MSAILSLQLVVHLLFSGGAVIYQISATALGILLATLTRFMLQFSLLVMPVLVVINPLSGSMTPMESTSE